MNKYILYARKSTDDEERQILSIEAQLAELREFARQNNLEIIEELIEAKTAKEPGRPIFNLMLEKIVNGEADGIISWNPDRLARNAVDGGQIINLIDRGKLHSLKFPTYWFEPSSQGLFMLQIAFGQAKYYIDNLSENVKRGLRQKLRRGEWPGWAPIGYTNNLRNHTIEIDKGKAPLIKRLFQEYSSGKYSLKDLETLSLSLKLKSQRGRIGLSCSVLEKLLRNKFYIGLFSYGGETYEAKHEPLIDKATFDLVQRILQNRSRPRKTKELLYFPFRGVFNCGECGRAITGERQIKKSGLVFRYYRCTKKNSKCSQTFVREEKLISQVDKVFSKVALKDDWTNKMLKQIEIWKADNIQSSALAIKEIEKELEMVNKRLSKLLDAHLDGLLEAEEYQAKKSELVEQKVALKQKNVRLNRKGNLWLEPLENWVIEVRQASNLQSSENFVAKAELLKKIGSNRLVGAGIVALKPENPWDILFQKTSHTNWRDGRVSNPQPRA